MKTIIRFVTYVYCLAGWCASLTAATTTAYVPVCCDANSTVSVIGTASNRLIGSFSAGPGSYAVALPDAGTAWVTNAGNNSISIVSLETGAVLKTVQLTLQPWLIQASPDGAKVYAVTGMFTGSLQHYSSTLQVFNAKTGVLITKVALPNDGLANPGLAVAPDSSHVYATFDSQTVVVYDVASGTASATWQTTRALTWTATGTLTLSPDGQTLYTSGEVLTAIATATGSVIGTVNPPGPSRSTSFVGSAVSSDGSTLYASVALQIGTGSWLVAIDTASLAMTGSASLGKELQQPVLSKDGSTLYVLDAIDSLLYVVSSSNLTPTASIALQGPVAEATLSADGSALYVPNSSTASTLAVDTSSFSVVASIGVGGTALNSELELGGTTAPTPTGNGSSIFVAGIQSNSISEIETATNKVAHTYSTGIQIASVTGDNVPAILVTPNGQQIYLAGGDYGLNLTEIDAATGKVNLIPCEFPSACTVAWMAALPNSSRVYMEGFGFSDDPNGPVFLDVVDTSTLTVIASPPMTSVGAMAVSPTGKFVYISTGSIISILDTATNAITGTLPIGGFAAMGFSPDGSTAYAVNGGTLTLIDTASGLVTGTVGLGTGTAIGVSVTPDGSQVWVTFYNSTSVAVVTTRNNVVQMVDLGLTVSGVAFGGQ
jgi:DNA-binding beta-propeller fold protein YncE